MLVSKDTLLQILDQIRKSVEEGDSFQGTITYDFMHGREIVDDKGVEVTASIRTGNLLGQGSTSIIEPTGLAL